jgi:sugar lactone lactonase YvrE
MTAADHGDWAQLFVTNVLNGTVAANGATVDRGTVLRIDLAIGDHAPYRADSSVIGSGFPERTDPAALVVGPTGVELGEDGTLYVADTAGNRIAAIPDATDRRGSDGTGRTLTEGGALAGPLGLITGPHDSVLTVNGGNGLLVATDTHGTQVQTVQLDSQNSPPGSGALFGLARQPGTDDVYFVDDNANTLNILG